MSEDKRSENALLRSRIDEQSQLIVILKQRLDESVRAAELREERNAVLLAECDKAREDLTMQRCKCDLLESRFDDLASNHQQMIDVSARMYLY